jgi:hypothetical protein
VVAYLPFQGGEGAGLLGELDLDLVKPARRPERVWLKRNVDRIHTASRY